MSVPDPLAQRAAWIQATQRDADERFDFVGTGEIARTAVNGVGFDVSTDGLSFGETWRVELALSAFGRESRMTPVQPGSLEVDGNVASIDRPLVDEQWISGPLGVEHVLELHARPAGSGDLLVDVAVIGRVRAVMEDGAVALRDGHDDVVRARYSDVWVADADGAVVPARIELASSGDIQLRISDADARYPLVIDPLVGVERAHLFSPTAAAGDGFGNSVAFDGTNAIVGAFGANAAAGAVFAYVRTSGTFGTGTPIVGTGTLPNDQFGASIAMSGDTLVVGSPLALSNGRAYVFVRSSAGVWTQQQILAAADGAAGDRFGAKVAIDGNTIVVSGPRHATTAGAGAGAVYVYTRAGTTWTQAAELFPSTPAASDRFGSSIAISGGTIVASTLTDDVFVFVGGGTAWAQQQILAPSNLAAGDGFGFGVAISGDRIIAGSPFHHTTFSGELYVFDRSGTTWTQSAAFESSVGGNIGANIAFAGNTVATYSNAANGTVVIFQNTGATWSETGRVVAADGNTADSFGAAISVVTDELLIGAFLDDTSAGTDAGSAYVEQLRSANGDACTTGATCATGNCVDGVCCNTTCGGGVADCQACSVAAGAAVNGTCGNFAAGTTCRAAVAGGCDVPETCTGTTGTCPADVVAVAGTACRAAAGDCDVADTCDGTSASCADARVAAGTVCRASTGNVTCDPAETCVASSPSCPADTNTNGTSCSDGVACNGAETCMSGACASGTAPTCDDSDVCTADMCAEPAGCAHAHIAGCCNVAADCDDGDMCTADSCSGAGGTCSHTTIPGCVGFDAGPMPDAGHDAGHDAGRDGSVTSDAAADAGDAGPIVTPASSNCGCAAAGTSSGSAAAPFALLGLALVAASRRRRR